MPLVGPISADFHRAFASWVRVEPRCRSADFSQGLEARTADPLWMLGRQWQLGEMRGDDAGSPIDVEVQFQTTRVVAVGIDGTRAAIDAPLEALVERERAAWDWRARVRVGQQFERLAREALGDFAERLIGVYRAAFPIAAPAGAERVGIDRATQRFVRLFATRVTDGRALWTAMELRTLPSLPADAGVIQEEVDAVLDELRAWRERLFSQPKPGARTAWRPERLDYEFRIHAPVGRRDEVELTAAAYRNGDLDWHSCAVSAAPSGDWAALGPATETVRLRPTRASFPGMPHRRWWAFEDARIDFGAMEVQKSDLVRLALMEFALVYGDDWFEVPLSVPCGSLTRVTRLEVTDVFGQTRAIPRARNVGGSLLRRWEMFALSWRGSADGGGADFLFVPPAAGRREESAPVEEVRFLRDEGANMVWAVEHLLPNGIGDPVHGFDAQLERRAREREHAAAAAAAGSTAASIPGEPGATAPLSYRLATAAPPNWIPFIPAEAHAALGPLGPGRPSVRLVRAQMLRNEAAERPEPVPAMTRLLDPESAEPVRWMDEEAVPRSGVRVQLTWHRTRGSDGETYVWLGRKVLVGRGEGRSGLRFDVVR